MAVNNLNTPGVGIQPSLIDAKGDLLVGTANDAIDRLGVTGTTGAVLTADAGETTGLKWAAAGSVGGLVHINTTSFSAVASQSVNDVFSATYKNYKIIFTASGTLANLLFRVRVNGSDLSGSDYNYQYLLGDGSGASAVRSSNQTSFQAGGIGSTETQTILEVSNVFATKVTGFKSLDLYYASGTLTLPANFHLVGNVNNTSSYTGFTFFPSTGTMTGSISVYGYKE
jgi:hypothetical protein